MSRNEKRSPRWRATPSVVSGIAVAVVAACLYIGLPVRAVAQSAAKNSQPVKEMILADINRYIQSIDEANPDLAKGLWLQTDEATFVHPAGEESGWNNIKEHFYLGLMGKLFSKRNLQLVGTPSIQVFDCLAIAQFHWDFVATRRDNGKEAHTMGRESQVYARQADGTWRLAHVHYSGPPITIDTTKAQGF